MIRITNIALPLDHTPRALKARILEILGIPEKELVSYRISKKSIDARRQHAIKLVYSVVADVSREEEVLKKQQGNPSVGPYLQKTYQAPTVLFARDQQRPVIVGTGPAGLFAGLIFAEAGLEPLLIERGKKVRERTQDTFSFWKEGILDPESNVQFGEGGAGTFSDGKLYSRIRDPENRDQFVLQELVEAGAPEEILVESRPHIGTLKLVKIVKRIREKITDLGGEYRFQTKMERLLCRDNRVEGLELADGGVVPANQVILALGHSARDTFSMLADIGVALEPKPFSIGVRIEHLQEMIDQSQYGSAAGHPQLGPASYQLSHHSSLGRTVYSFCMCPGGTVLAAASEKGSIVTNGMSQYARQQENANSALVVEVFPGDFPNNVLGGIIFQRKWEKLAFQAGGGNYYAPVQRVGDFLSGKISDQLGPVRPTYQPGFCLADLNQLLPGFAAAALQEAIPAMEKKIRGFAAADAVLTGVETRTSSPIRILRGQDLESVNLGGLYPAGEGSGYAGGILSSAVDGMRAAEAVIKRMNEA